MLTRPTFPAAREASRTAGLRAVKDGWVSVTDGDGVAGAGRPMSSGRPGLLWGRPFANIVLRGQEDR
jgi:hypothetical protein